MKRQIKKFLEKLRKTVKEPVYIPVMSGELLKGKTVLILTKVRNKQEELEARLFDLQNKKQEIETKQVMDAFKKSGKSMHELMVFFEG